MVFVSNLVCPIIGIPDAVWQNPSLLKKSSLAKALAHVATAATWSMLN